MSILKSIQSAFVAALLVAIFAGPAVSMGFFPKPPEKGQGGAVGTPAPIAGIGLVGIGVIGAAMYLAVRRYRRPDKD